MEMSGQLSKYMMNQLSMSYFAMNINYDAGLIQFYQINIIYLMQQNKEEKQQYLREEILEAGHDVQDFIQFLSTYELGNDIDKISLKKLREIVETYCKKKAEQLNSTTKACRQVGFEFSSILKQEKKQSKPFKFVKRYVIQEKYGLLEPELTKVFKCRKWKVEEQLKSSPKIEVNTPQRNSIGGFFGIGKTSFWSFEIITYNRKWKVKRRYSDFVWLRSMLLKFYPTYVIPPLPPKKASKKTPRDLDKRMRILTYFLNDVVSFPQILQSKYVEGFLSIVKDSEFEKLKKEGASAQPFESIVSLETESGEVTVSLSEQQKLFHQQFSTFINSAEVVYKQINKNAKILQTNILEQTNTLYTMGNQFADLYSSLKAFNTKLPQFAQTALNDTYIRLNNMMIQWGNLVKNQHNFIEKSFLPFFRYCRHELYSFRQLSSKVLQCQQQYFKTRIALEKRKEKLFHNNDINKWEIRPTDLPSVPATATKNKAQAFEYMLPKQTFELDKLRLNYAFYSSQFQDHTQSLLRHGALRINQNFKQFAINIKVNTQQMAGLWTEVATNFADPDRKLEIMVSEIEPNQIEQNKENQDENDQMHN